APHVCEPLRPEERRGTVVADEVGRLEHDALVVRPFGLELARPGLEQLEHAYADPTTRHLRMHVRVADEARALAVEELRDARQPPVELDEPRVAVEVDPLPVLAQVALGPVRIAPDRLVGCLQERERLGQAVGRGARHDHAPQPRSTRPAERCGPPYSGRMVVRTLAPVDWPDVVRIYGEGLATRVATFETEVPSWETWNGVHLPAPRLVAERDGG